MCSGLVRLGFSICIGLAIASIALAQPSGRKITRIEAEGLKTMATDTVIATSGLKIGDGFSVAVVDAAAQRLLDSGLFKTVGYRTRTAGSFVTVVFQLEELKGKQSPVVFDNFIWFTDEELTAAVKRAVPAFDGSAPDIGNTTETIKQALQDLLLTRKLPGKVEYMLTETAHLFSVADVPMKICTLHFPGSHAVSEQKLIQTTRSGTDPNYSRQSATTFPKYGLYPLYREIGHLRATFGSPTAKPDTNPGCEGGVDLTIPVNEGAVYSWAKAEWSGNQVLSANELDDVLGMKSGEVANGKKFDKGVREVEKSYGKHGHINARLIPNPEFDDANQRVTYRIAVSEGPQYRMGTVEFKGFSNSDAAALSEKWRLKSGDIYDQSYGNRFLRDDAGATLSKIANERKAQQRPLPNINILERPNRGSLTVNLIVEIKN
jgi:outer membrane protein assembly factor BamA